MEYHLTLRITQHEVKCNTLFSIDITHVFLKRNIWCKIQTFNTAGECSNTNPQWRNIHKETCSICGHKIMPIQQGKKLIQYTSTNYIPLIRVSDASIVNGNGTHTWILTTNDAEHIDDKSMMISGSGPIHGHPCDVSFTWGELHGQEVVTIMSKILLQTHNAMHIPITLKCNKKNIIQGGYTEKKCKIGNHRPGKMDLYREQWDIQWRI